MKVVDYSKSPGEGCILTVRKKSRKTTKKAGWWQIHYFIATPWGILETNL